MALTLLSLSFLVFLVLGMPVAFAIGLSCLVTFAYEGLPFETAIQMMVSGMNVFSFLAIPFFIFSGELMLHGGIADKIVAFARSLVGHWKGGLGLANVVASTLFGGVSGSPVADTSAMGGVMIPIMKKEGYSAAYAVNVTTHASLSGALMPTSHNMIIYAFAAQAAAGEIAGHVIKGVSIGDLMFAGLIPVFWIMVCMLVAAYWQAAKNGFPRRADGSSMSKRRTRTPLRSSVPSSVVRASAMPCPSAAAWMRCAESLNIGPRSGSGQSSPAASNQGFHSSSPERSSGCHRERSTAVALR
jgi:tripartite ATP-independent transporter DctM subunit